MNITTLLKDHMVKSFGLAADATDGVVTNLVGEKLGSGELAPAKYQELTKAAGGNGNGGGAGSAQQIIDAAIDKKIAPLASDIGEIKSLLLKGQGNGGGAGGDGGNGAGNGNGSGGGSALDLSGAGGDGAPLFPAGHVEIDVATKMLASSTSPNLAGTAGTATGSSTDNKAAGGSAAHQVMMGGAGTGGNAPRVKSVSELYSQTKSAATYDQSTNLVLKEYFGGRPVMSQSEGEGAHPIDHPSQLDKAVCGSWFKFALLHAARRGGYVCRLKMTEHDTQLVNYALHEMPFGGQAKMSPVAGNDGDFAFNNRKLFEWERKALLDDALSGGLEAAPIAFDDAVILTPLLHGEIYPYVNVVVVTRGRRIEAFSIGNPTFQWGISEGTNIPLFNTDGFISAFDNTIFNGVGAMTIGLDFEDDTPNNIGQIVLSRYGEAAKKDLDRICAIGDGLVEPLGLMNSVGIAAISSENGVAGPPTIGDYSALQFGLAKEFRERRSMYLSNDLNYQRSRNMKVDPSSPSTDERRVLGMNFQDYSTLGYPHRIQNGIPNSKAGFFDPGRFRLYRRAGLSIQIERAGQSLVLSNQQLIVCRMRFGGSLEHSGAGAMISDLDS